MVDLAKFYNGLGCKTISALSKRTYLLREDKRDIPYINSEGWVSPLKTQKNWKFYYDEDTLNGREEEGFTRIDIHEKDGNLNIMVFSTHKIDGQRERRILYSNSKDLDWSHITNDSFKIIWETEKWN